MKLFLTVNRSHVKYSISILIKQTMYENTNLEKIKYIVKYKYSKLANH